jgi:HK97 family phage major capsid protein
MGWGKNQMDIKALRAEFSRVQTEGLAVIEKAMAENRAPTAEETKANEERFARMETIKKQIDQHLKFAGCALVAGEVQLPVEAPGKEAFDGFATGSKINRKEFAKAAGEWLRSGNMAQKFAAITTATQNSILLPVEVAQPIVPFATNAFRDAYTAYGMSPMYTESTATLDVPILDAATGGVVAENATTENESEPGLTHSYPVVIKTVGSPQAWFSNQAIQAVGFDLLEASVPAMKFSAELGLEAAIVAAIKADGGVTQSVTASADSGDVGFDYDNLVDLNRSFKKKYDRLKVIILSQTSYAFAEKLTTSTGYPILNADAQNQELKRFNGTPVLRSDALEAFGAASRVIGLCISLVGFTLRDAGQPNLTRYVNIPTRQNQTGLALFQYNGWGYSTEAITKLVTAS